MTETVTPLSETVSQIVRSRTCGCRDFYIAKITQNDATGYVAGTPVKLARAIKAKVDENGLLKRFTPMTERRRSSTHTMEQRSNLRSMHLHHRTDRFYSGSYTRTVSSLRQPTTKHRRSLSDGVREN